MQAAFSVQIVESFTIYFKIICSLLVLSQLFSVLIYPMNTAHRNMTINITHTFFFFFSFRERVVTWGGGCSGDGRGRGRETSLRVQPRTENKSQTLN